MQTIKQGQAAQASGPCITCKHNASPNCWCVLRDQATLPAQKIAAVHYRIASRQDIADTEHRAGDDLFAATRKWTPSEYVWNDGETLPLHIQEEQRLRNERKEALFAEYHRERRTQ